MTTKIAAHCYHCGKIHLDPDDLVVAADAGHNRGSYSFECPRCGITSTRTADRNTLRLLASGGVVIEVPPPPLHFSPDDALDVFDLYRLSTDRLYERLTS